MQCELLCRADMRQRPGPGATAARPRPLERHGACYCRSPHSPRTPLPYSAWIRNLTCPYTLYCLVAC